MDACAWDNPVHHTFRLEGAEPIELFAAVEAATGFAAPLALEVELADLHRTFQYHQTNHERDPLAILVLTPALPAGHQVEPSYGKTESWIRPSIDRAVLAEVEARIAQLDDGDPEWAPSWSRAILTPMAVRLPCPDQLAGRAIYMFEHDGTWERAPIRWQDGEPWVLGTCSTYSPLAIEIDAEYSTVDVRIRWSTWDLARGPGRHDLAAYLSRLEARGFTRAS